MSRPKPWEIDDDLWALIEPLLPVVERRPDHPGRKRLDDRKALQGILFVLATDIQWEWLPQELGFGSGMTCWRRLRDWNQAGVWQQLQAILLAKLRGANQLDFSRAAIDASHVRALRGGPKTGPSPVDRARPGSKHHLITDARGTPLAVSLTGGNRNDVTQLMPLLKAIPAVRGRRERPRFRPRRLYADRGDDHDRYRRVVRTLSITPVIARRGQSHGSGLGVHRWVVERGLSWLHGFRHLRIRWERRDDIHDGFLQLAVCLILYRRVRALC
ncbi:IS5 family transposase [Streptomyces hirsutus]|uniref:IS5 family transposase n=1 Tax=Streptomyces hirsutus TaxID=35620 RepID=UPI0033A56E71